MSEEEWDGPDIWLHVRIAGDVLWGILAWDEYDNWIPETSFSLLDEDLGWRR